MRVAILVPIYKTNFTELEELSLLHLERHLGGFSRISIQPAGLGVNLPGFERRELPAHHFASISAYSKLLLSPFFYGSFLEFDHILIYQLDCLVFSNDLDAFCAMNYDYIGAPLFEKDRLPPRMSRVGNGGLSLRRVKAFLDVLHSDRTPSWGSFFTVPLPDLQRFPAHKRWLKEIRIIRDARRGVRWYTQHYSLNEDLFWSDRAKLFDPEFRIAPLDVALHFAFDAHPSVCFEKNGQHLPFGAHAWNKWDRAFWEPYLQV